MEVEGSYCGDEIDFTIMCFCGQIAPLCKSKSEANPGRRFFGCSNYMNEENCKFFCWYDPSPFLKKTGVLRPMKIWKATEVAKASEQAESSWTPLKKNEEIHSERSEYRNIEVENFVLWCCGFINGLLVHFSGQRQSLSIALESILLVLVVCFELGCRVWCTTFC